MAEAPENAELTTEQDAAPKKKKPVMLIGLIAGVALIEAIGFFVFIKFFYATPEPAYGGEGEHAIVEEPTAETDRSAEVELVKRFRVPNNSKGVSYIYDFDIAVLVPAAKQEFVTQLVTERQAQIHDRVAQLVRAASARVLDEVDFKSLRLQLTQALGEIFGDDQLVQQVLIPRCVPIRAD